MSCTAKRIKKIAQVLAAFALSAISFGACANVGWTTIDDGGSASASSVLPVTATLRVTVFYPTQSAETAHQRGPFQLYLAQDGAPVARNRRLVIISHGSGGSPWPHADLAIALVRAGYIVALPEHEGDNWRDHSKVGPPSWKLRPAEVTRAIDRMIADPRFGTLFDQQRVAVYGMSAGNFTALILAGARWSPAAFAKHCDQHIAQDFPTCVGLFSSLTGSHFDALRIWFAINYIGAGLNGRAGFFII